MFVHILGILHHLVYILRLAFFNIGGPVLNLVSILGLVVVHNVGLVIDFVLDLVSFLCLVLF